MAARSNSYGVWILTGALLGLAMTMVVRPTFWWLGLLGGSVTFSFVRALPTFLRGLARLFVYCIRRAVECRMAYATLGNCLVSGGLWVLLYWYVGRRETVGAESFVGVLPLLALTAMIILMVAAACISIHLVVLWTLPKMNPGGDNYRDLKRFAWYTNPIVLSCILLPSLIGGVLELFLFIWKFPVLTIAASVAIGAVAGHLVGDQAAVGAAVGFVLGSLAAIRQRRLVAKSD